MPTLANFQIELMVKTPDAWGPAEQILQGKIAPGEKQTHEWVAPFSSPLGAYWYLKGTTVPTSLTVQAKRVVVRNTIQQQIDPNRTEGQLGEFLAGDLVSFELECVS